MAGRDIGDVAWTEFFPAGWTNQRPLTSGVTVSDPGGLDPSSVVYRTSLDGGSSWSVWTTDGLSVNSQSGTTISIQVSGLQYPDSQTQNRIQFRVNTLGRAEEISEAYAVAVDTLAPGLPANLQSDPDHWTNVNHFVETWTNPPDLSGIVGAYYRLNQEPQFPTDGTFVATSDILTDVQVSGEGIHSILVWLEDAAGNVDHRNYRVDLGAFRLDTTVPTVGVARSGPLGNNDWYTGTVQVIFTPIDSLSGVDGWGWRLDDLAASSVLSTFITSDLEHTLAVTATDVAGNAAEPATLTIPIDSQPPVFTHSVATEPSASGWYTAPITVTFGLSDAVSGPDTVAWQLDEQPPATGLEVVLSQQGLHSLAAYGLDLAGNRSPGLRLDLPLDSQPPTTTLTITPAMAPSGYFTAPVALDFEVTDGPGGSGVLASWVRVNHGGWQVAEPFTLQQDGAYQVDYVSMDVAGNREISRTLPVRLDATPPGPPQAVAVEPAGWSAVNDFTLTWENPEDASGVAGAYVFLGEGPPGPGDGVFYPSTTQIDGLTAPGEGQWPVWMWLVDVAGNQDRQAAVQMAALAFDATPPELQVEVEGTQGNAGWYTGPVAVTVRLADAGSGPAELRYRLDGESWQQTGEPQVVLNVGEAGKHVLETEGEDLAGYLSGPYLETLRLDPDPPGPPVAPAVAPAGWTNTDQFTVTWLNPLDASGVVTAYLALEPPAGPRSGQPVPAGDEMATIQVPDEDAHDLYLWLEDVAGNASVAQAGILPGALRYDATPPVTAVRYGAQPNPAGWFRDAVAVTLAVTDTLSGAADTTWQLDGQPAQSGNWLFVNGDGVHELLVQSTDQAGNWEDQTSHQIRIDSLAPVATLHPLESASPSTEFEVRWDGQDPEATGQAGDASAGSGIAGYDVQVQVGASGTWQPWLDGTAQTAATYTGQRGAVYAFRVRSWDAAGNVSAWSTAGGNNHVFVDPIDNGLFETLNFDGWDTIIDLQMVVLRKEGPNGDADVPVAQLGWEGYQSCADPGNVPVGRAGIAQTVEVPPLSEVAHPVLTVWYRIRTYDQMSTTSGTQPVDTFDVTVLPAGSATADLLLRDGNPVPIEFIGQNPPIPFWDLGWRLAVLDMSPYAGQTVRLELSNYNRIDNRFNTWTDVYAVRLRDWPWQQRLYLPAVGAPGRGPVEPDGICYPYGLNGSLQGAESSDEGRWRSELAPLGPEDSGP